MPGDFRPRNWTKRARRRGGLVAVLAVLVVASYAWVNSAWLGIIFLDAISMIDPAAERALTPFWGIIGLATIIFLPVFVADRIGAWMENRRRRSDR